MQYHLSIDQRDFSMSITTPDLALVQQVLASFPPVLGAAAEPVKDPPKQLEQGLPGGPVMPAAGTLADVFAKEQEKTAAIVAAGGPEVLPPVAPAAPKKTAAKKNAAPKPVAVMPPPAAEAAPEIDILQIPVPAAELAKLQNEVSDLTMAAISRNRPAVIELFGEFGTTNYSGIKFDIDKLRAFRDRVIQIKPPQARS